MFSSFLTAGAILLATASAAPQGGPPGGGGTTAQSPAYTWLFQFPLPIPATAQPLQQVTVNGRTIQYFELNIQSFTQQVYPNLGRASLVGYNGTFPGPTFRVQQGVESVVRLRNSGSQPATMHLHGSASHSTWDGWASDLIQPGQYKDYYYPNFQAAPLWYHDHAEGITAPHTYYGQCGFHIISDPAENSLGLPTGNYDIPLSIADKIYNSTGGLVSPTSNPTGFYGDIIHVNGQPWPYLKVEPRKYRLRFYDMSLSRPYGLTFQNAQGSTFPVTVIASDSGLFQNSVTATNITIAMGERYEVVVDFSAYKGTNVTLANTYSDPFTPQFTNTNKIMRFVVGTTVSDTTNNGPVPSTLKSVNFPPPRSGIDRVFNFQRGVGDALWTINGEAFSDVNNRVLAQMPQGAEENWQFNYQGGPGVHPVHLHLVNFQITSRTGGSRGVQPYESAGLKDIVLLEAGESVTVRAIYGPYNGLYMFHCHNLIHEDNNMMAVFNVTKLAALGYDFNSTQGFDNPTDPRYAAVNYNAAAYTPTAIRQKLRAFAKLNAYAPASSLIQAEANYWATAPYPKPTSS